MATFHTATPRSRTMAWPAERCSAWIDKIDAGMAVSESARDVVVALPGHSDAGRPPSCPTACRTPNSRVAAARSHRGVARRRPAADHVPGSAGRAAQGTRRAAGRAAGDPGRRRPTSRWWWPAAGSRRLPAGLPQPRRRERRGEAALLAHHRRLRRPAPGAGELRHRPGRGAGQRRGRGRLGPARRSSSCSAERPGGRDLGRLVPVGDPAALAAAVIDRIDGRTPSAQTARRRRGPTATTGRSSAPRSPTVYRRAAGRRVHRLAGVRADGTARIDAESMSELLPIRLAPRPARGRQHGPAQPDRPAARRSRLRRWWRPAATDLDRGQLGAGRGRGADRGDVRGGRAADHPARAGAGGRTRPS